MNLCCYMPSNLEGVWLEFRNPLEIRTIYYEDDLWPLLKADLEKAEKSKLWWAGVLAYEAAKQPFSESPERTLFSSSALKAQWALFESCRSLSKEELRTEILGEETAPLVFSQIKYSRNFTDYKVDFAAIREALQSGMSYQANLSFEAELSFRAVLESNDDSSGICNEAALWSRLALDGQGSQGVFWSCSLEGQETCIISASPELFFSKTGKHIVSRPMKGTSARGKTDEEDRRLTRELEASEKNRAENLMIVDMIRNDLGKLARTGSVKVSKLFSLETYPTVHQMTSTVEADSDSGVCDLLEALFPCASICGAPKISTLKLLSKTEQRLRGFYTGSAGWVSPHQDAWFNVLIRSLVGLRRSEDKRTQVYSLGLGGGITWDSKLADEYNEALLKGRFCQSFLPESFYLFSSLRYDPALSTKAIFAPSSMRQGHKILANFFLLERHLERLKKASADFAWVYKEDQLVELLLSWFLNLDSSSRTKAHKIKLCIFKDAPARLESQMLETPFYAEAQKLCPQLSLALADKALPKDALSRMQLLNKSSLRRVHETLNKPGFDQTLFYQADGSLTETSTCNIVLQFKTSFLTPKHTGWFLKGTFISNLLEDSKVKEAELGIKDLWKADAVWLLNSVRGWQKAQAFLT